MPGRNEHAEHGVVLDVVHSFNIPSCSICGAVEKLRRGWCEMHYQRWYRTGDPNKIRRRVVSVDGKKTFTKLMWTRWLDELNTPPNLVAIENIEAVRNAIEEVEQRSTWNQHQRKRGL